MQKLIFENIKKSYGAVEVVKDISFEINEGEFVVLVGPSGCGKSTTLRMIAGLEEISEGHLKINGDVVNDVNPSNRDVAMVFQDYALYPHMSVFDNMAFSLKLKKIEEEEIKQRVNTASDMLDLTNYLDRKPSELSGGQRQRVAMGRAIVKNSSIFLYDEPLSNLDAKLRTKMRAEIKKFHNKSKSTSVYVTHDQLEAMTLADKLVVMKDGKIEQMGTPLDIFNFPKSLFVATFIGSPEMNILACSVKREGDKIFILGEKNAFLFDLPESKSISFRTLLKDKEKKTISLGIRPTDVFESKESDDLWSAEGVIELVEYLGCNAHVETSLGNYLIRSEVVCTNAPKLGDEFKLHFNLHYAHFFDEYGLRID